MKRISEQARVEGIQQFIYGENGVGKSAWAGAAAGNRTIIVTTGNGAAVYRSKWWREKYRCDPFIEYIKLDDDPTLPRVLDNVRNTIENLLVKENRDQWDALVLDDINDIRVAARMKAIELNGFSGRSQTYGKGKEKGGKMHGYYLPTISDFGTEMGITDNFLRQLTDGMREERKHLFVCGHQRLYRKEGSNVVVATKPLVTGTDTPDSLPGIFDNVWYMRVVGTGTNTKREIITDAQEGIMAKTRWSGLFKPTERDLEASTMLERIMKWQVEGT